MGTTYHYAYLTRREWFPTDALGGNPKIHGLGLNLTARAFDLLLMQGYGRATPEDVVDVGRWTGDAVAVIGDTDDNWIQYDEEFTDLTADVILFMVAWDGFDVVGDAAENDSILFMQLAHLVVTHQAPDLEPHMRRRFGNRFWEQYKDLCRGKWFRPKDITRPGPR